MTKTLNKLFLNELADVYDAEHRITKALPKMAKAATSEALKGAFEKHLEETKGQIARLEEVFQCFDQKPKRKACKAMQGLMEEGDEIMEEFKGSPAIDSALIAAAQKVEHYEMASYGCLAEWASLLANPAAADLLNEILDQETNANDVLTNLAETECNEAALGGSEEDEEAPETRKKPAAKKAGSSPMASAGRSAARAR